MTAAVRTASPLSYARCRILGVFRTNGGGLPTVFLCLATFRVRDELGYFPLATAWAPYDARAACVPEYFFSCSATPCRPSPERNRGVKIPREGAISLRLCGASRQLYGVMTGSRFPIDSLLLSCREAGIRSEGNDACLLAGLCRGP